MFDLDVPTGVVAAFDFDGTLTTRDCVVPFLRRTAPLPRLVAGLLSTPHRTVPALARRDRDGLKALAARTAFEGRTASDIASLGQDYARHVIDHWLRPDTTERLEKYLAAGVPVVIISASFEPYLEPIGKHLGVDAVLATRLEVAGERLTGSLDGANCRGDEKLRRLDAWCASQGRPRADVTLHAYGDSAGDHALLRAAQKGWWAADGQLVEWTVR